MSDENFNPDAPLHIRGVNHLAIPVKDRYRAACFFIAVLGGEAHYELAPARAAEGLARSLQVGVRLAPGFEIDLFEQDYGRPDWNQSHPHLAFDTSAEDLTKWTESFKKWQVPFVGPMTRDGTKGVEFISTMPTAIISKFTAPTCRKPNASNFRPALTTKASAFTNRRGRRKN